MSIKMNKLYSFGFELDGYLKVADLECLTTETNHVIEFKRFPLACLNFGGVLNLACTSIVSIVLQQWRVPEKTRLYSEQTNCQQQRTELFWIGCHLCINRHNSFDGSP
jgi:hypothetical protein